MSHRYLDPIDKNGRGAGGHCFVKDFETFIALVHSLNPDHKTLAILESIRDKNIDLLFSSRKDVSIVEGVYGKTILP